MPHPSSCSSTRSGPPSNELPFSLEAPSSRAGPNRLVLRSGGIPGIGSPRQQGSPAPSERCALAVAETPVGGEKHDEPTNQQENSGDGLYLPHHTLPKRSGGSTTHTGSLHLDRRSARSLRKLLVWARVQGSIAGAGA